MPTQEERLTALEKRTASSIREINENAAMTIGLVKQQSYDVSRMTSDIKNIREVLDIRFDATNAHLNLLQSHADRTDKKLNAIDTRLDAMDTQLNQIRTTLTQILTLLTEKP